MCNVIRAVIFGGLSGALFLLLGMTAIIPLSILLLWPDAAPGDPAIIMREWKIVAALVLIVTIAVQVLLDTAALGKTILPLLEWRILPARIVPFAQDGDLWAAKFVAHEMLGFGMFSLFAAWLAQRPGTLRSVLADVAERISHSPKARPLLGFVLMAILLIVFIWAAHYAAVPTRLHARRAVHTVPLAPFMLSGLFLLMLSFWRALELRASRI